MAEANQDLTLRRGHVIPGAELEWSFGPSGGPGGQHANRAHTRTVLRFDVADSMAFDDSTRQRLLDRVESPVVVTVDEHRSQWRNRQVARRRLSELLDDALKPDPPRRRATKPSRGAKQRRLDSKRRRSETKRLRRKPNVE